MNPKMIWIAYSILKISLCPVGWTPHIWVLVGGFHPIGARYVVQHLVGLSMRGTYYMGAGGPVEAGACSLILVLRQPGGHSHGRTKLHGYRWTFQ